MSGRIPMRVEAVTKKGLMELVEEAVASGWSAAAACSYLELPPRRLQRWRRRLSSGDGLEDRTPGGNPGSWAHPRRGRRDRGGV
ncbi:MAG: hypothetical protein GEU79_08920 [Acidimicrobiia bacterium]|nr:hypothetical protein [Acidimicrobiia bacterium]